MRGCELLWDMETADEVQRVVERATGEPCPCFKEERCPLLPDGFQLVDADTGAPLSG